MTNYKRVFAMSFARVYPHYVAKAAKKGRTGDVVDEGIRWLIDHLQRATSSPCHA